MDKEYLRELFIELPESSDFTVLKINDKYLKITTKGLAIYIIEFIEPKTKTVIYFD